MILKKQQSYLQTLGEHNTRVPVLCTVYGFTYRGCDFYVAHDMRNDKYWNVFDPGTGLAIWNGFARKSRKDAINVFTSENNVEKFIRYLEFIKTDSYKRQTDEFYFAVRAAMNEAGKA